MNTAIQLGNAWGLGVVAAVVAATSVPGGGASDPGALVGGLRWGLLACAGFAASALAVVLLGLRGDGERERRAAGGKRRTER